MATQTWTLDVAGLPYVDKDGIQHTITTNETFTLDFTDDGVGGRFIGLSGTAEDMVCTDGFRLKIHADPRFEFTSSADGSATLRNGHIAFIEEGNVLNEWSVASLTMSNADGVGANNVTSITLQQVANRMRSITWTNINTA